MVASPDAYEPEPGENVSDTVVRALADSKGSDPIQLDVQLYDGIDPDALDALFASGGDATGRRVAFSIADRRIVVDESRCVYVSRSEESRSSAPPSPDPQILRGAASPWRMVFRD